MRTVGSVVVRGYLWLLLGWLGINGLAVAEPWRVLVLPQAGPQSAMAPEPAVTRLEATLEAKLIELGFDVFDKSLMPLPGCGKGGCRGLTDAQLQQLAKDAPLDIDLLLLFQLSASAQSESVIAPWRLQLAGHLVDIASGRRIAAWQGAARQTPAKAAGCRGDCLAQWLAEHSQPLAANLGTVLAQKLAQFQRTLDYGIEIRDFPPDEAAALENYLRSLDGYVQGGFTLLRDLGQQRRWLHQVVSKSFRYRSALASSRLSQKLEAVLRYNRVPATLTYAKDQHQFIITRQGQPFAAGYAAALLSLVLGLASFALWLLARRRLGLLAHCADNNQVAGGLAILQRRPRWLLAGGDRAQSLEKQWRRQLADSEQLWHHSQGLAEQGHYVEVLRHLTELRAIRSDHEQANALYSTLVQWQRRIDEATTRMASASNQSRWYAALACLDELLQQIDAEPPVPPPLRALRQQALDKLDDHRHALLAKLIRLEGDVSGQQALGGWQFLMADQLMTGRPAGHDCPGGSLVMDFRRLSPLGHQCRIQRQSSGYFVTDLGSSNGSWLAGRPLRPGSPQRLEQPLTELAMGGQQTPAEKGICRLQLCLPSSGDALVLVPDREVFELVDPRAVDGWPSLSQDMGSRWVMLADKLPFGVDEAGQLDMGCLTGASPSGYLHYDDGLWLSPATPGSPELTIDGAPLWRPLPVQAGATVTVGAQSFGFMAAIDSVLSTTTDDGRDDTARLDLSAGNLRVELAPLQQRLTALYTAHGEIPAEQRGAVEALARTCGVEQAQLASIQRMVLADQPPAIGCWSQWLALLDERLAGQSRRRRQGMTAELRKAGEALGLSEQQVEQGLASRGLMIAPPSPRRLRWRWSALLAASGLLALAGYWLAAPEPQILVGQGGTTENPTAAVETGTGLSAGQSENAQELVSSRQVAAATAVPQQPPMQLAVERQLARIGYFRGAPDDREDPEAVNALGAFLRDNGLARGDLGAAELLAQLEANPGQRPIDGYLVAADGTVSDPQSGLMWMRCSLGLDWHADSHSCRGRAMAMGPSEAPAFRNGFAGYHDWRLPTINELRTLLMHGRQPKINGEVFVDVALLQRQAPGALFYRSNGAWHLNLTTGQRSLSANSNHPYRVRLVRRQ